MEYFWRWGRPPFDPATVDTRKLQIGDYPPRAVFVVALFRKSELTLKQVECAGRLMFALDSDKSLVCTGASLVIDMSITADEFYSHVETISGIPPDLKEKIEDSKHFLIRTAESHLYRIIEYELARDDFTAEDHMQLRRDPSLKEIYQKLFRLSRMWLDEHAFRETWEVNTELCLTDEIFAPESSSEYVWNLKSQELDVKYGPDKHSLRDAIERPSERRIKTAHRLYLDRIANFQHHPKRLASWFFAIDEDDFLVEYTLFLDLDTILSLEHFFELLEGADTLPEWCREQLTSIKKYGVKVAEIRWLRLVKYYFPMTEAMKEEIYGIPSNPAALTALQREMGVARILMDRQDKL